MRNSKGFTLIEILVVVAIIALISALAMPSISSFFQISLGSTSREMASIIKEAYNAAVVTGKVYRVAYDLKENSYWVEAGPSNSLLDTKETREREERRRKFSSRLSDAPPPPSQFMMDTMITRKKKKLPRGVVFEDILTQQSPDPINVGTAYSHFFPNGLSEQTIVHIKDLSNHHASLAISALMGTTDLYDRYVNAKEIFEK